MDDREPAGAGRVLVWALAALVVVPSLLLFAFVLVTFLPEATGYTCGAGEPGCRRDPLDTVVWWVVLAATVAAAALLGVAWWRQWSAARWWPLPAAALGSVVVGVAALSVLAAG